MVKQVYIASSGLVITSDKGRWWWNYADKGRWEFEHGSWCVVEELAVPEEVRLVARLEGAA